MTTVKSGGNTNGTRSLLNPYFVLKCPRKCPKSMWNSMPCLLIMMLSGCLSPMPRTKVATQKPAQLRVKFSMASSKSFLFGLLATIHLYNWYLSPIWNWLRVPPSVWILNMVTEFLITSMKPMLCPVDITSYNNILGKIKKLTKRHLHDHSNKGAKFES